MALMFEAVSEVCSVGRVRVLSDTVKRRRVKGLSQSQTVLGEWFSSMLDEADRKGLEESDCLGEVYTCSVGEVFGRLILCDVEEGRDLV